MHNNDGTTQSRSAVIAVHFELPRENSKFPQKMKGANERTLYFLFVFIRGFVRFWREANS
jgi:hypothetical protein